MLGIDLVKIFDFMSQADIDPACAIDALLQEINTKELKIPEDTYKGIIGEWILFEYKQNSKPALIVQYLMRNPDGLSNANLEKIRQIVQSQFLGFFQTYRKTQPPYLYLQSIYTGEKYKVYDKLLSENPDLDNISFWGRLANVGGINYLIGSEPISLPVRYTNRMIKIFTDQKMPILTLREVIGLFIKTKSKKSRKIDIDKGRRGLKSKYLKLSIKYRCRVEYQKIVEFIFNEHYEKNFADYFTDLMKLGVPEKMCFENIKFFQEVWNYLPHKILGDKSPYERGKKMGLTDVD